MRKFNEYRKRFEFFADPIRTQKEFMVKKVLYRIYKALVACTFGWICFDCKLPFWSRMGRKDSLGYKDNCGWDVKVIHYCERCVQFQQKEEDRKRKAWECENQLGGHRDIGVFQLWGHEWCSHCDSMIDYDEEGKTWSIVKEFYEDDGGAYKK